jgi:small-conductance mechanosensitive channel
MHFDLYHWLFDDPVTAGANAGMSGAEPFHFLWPWLIFCCAGLLLTFYYSVEGRKRFVKSMPNVKRMFDRFLGWFAVICFVGLPLIFSREYLSAYFFAWRFWRYLWLVSLLAWAVWWVVYLIRRYPQERANFIAYQNRRQYIPKANKRKARV